jgi:hypothetical protein
MVNAGLTCPAHGPGVVPSAWPALFLLLRSDWLPVRAGRVLHELPEILTVTAATLAMLSAAAAADLPRKEPPPPAPPVGKAPIGKYPVGKYPVGKYPQPVVTKG